MQQTQPPPAPRPPSTAGDRLPLKHRLLLSLLFLAIIAVAGYFLRDAQRPLRNSQIKGIIAAALCAILLVAMWVPPVGRMLLRLFGPRRG